MKVCRLLFAAILVPALIAQTQGSAKSARGNTEPNAPSANSPQSTSHVTDLSRGSVDAEYQAQQAANKQADKDAQTFDAAVRGLLNAQANRIAADLKAARDNYLATRFHPLANAGQPSAGDGDRMNAAIDRTRQSLFPDSPVQGKEVYVQKTIGAGGSLDLIFDAGLEACIVNANRQPDVHGGFLLLSYSKYRKKDIWVKSDQTAFNDTLKPGESKLIRLPIFQGPQPQSVETTIEVRYWSQR